MQPKLLTADDLFPDQQAAVETILDFVDDHNATELLVEGAAGTGKTSSIRVAINELDRDEKERTVVCAPTNKAVKVARELSGGVVETTTIYKLLSLSPQANGEVKEIKQGENAHKKLLATSLVLLDEASMNGEVLKPYIRQAQMEYGIKFVYIGDRYQLNPVVKQDKDKPTADAPISWVFREVRQAIKLDKVKRHDNAILNLATHLREVMDNQGRGLRIEDCFNDSEGGVELFRRSKPFEELILDRWAEVNNSEERDFSANRVLAWRNTRVDGFNELVRETLYGRREARSQALMVGERIVVCNPVQSLNDSTVTLMHTDEEGFIDKLAIGPHPKYPEIECFKLAVLRESEEDLVGLFTPTPAGWRVANRMLEQFKKKALNEDRVFWGAYWNLSEMMNDVRPCHALTCHRSQGSTFREIFLDLDDVLANPRKIEALRAAYVGITRASYKVNVKWSGR